MPPYQLLALDLDGTTLSHVDDRFFFTPRVTAAVQAAMAQGVKVAIATGRSTASTREFVKALGTNAPTICHQGGTIYDFNAEHLLFERTLPIDLACRLVEFERLYPSWHAVIYRGEEVFITHKRYPDYFYDLVAVAPIIRPDLCAALEGREPDKVLFILPIEETPAALRIVSDYVGDQGNTVQSHALFVEVNPLGADKGSGLRWLANHLGIVQQDVMAVGDQGNDLTMVQWAGLGVAMGNGNPITQAAANWIAPAIDEDGAAVAIEKFILGSF